MIVDRTSYLLASEKIWCCVLFLFCIGQPNFWFQLSICWFLSLLIPSPIALDEIVCHLPSPIGPEEISAQRLPIIFQLYLAGANFTASLHSIMQYPKLQQLQFANPHLTLQDSLKTGRRSFRTYGVQRNLHGSTNLCQVNQRLTWGVHYQLTDLQELSTPASWGQR